MNVASKIQLLTDGELDHQSRAELLKQAEQDSQIWRAIALAFVEQQLMDEALGELSLIGNEKVAPENQSCLPVVPVDSSETKRWFWVAGIAASLLIGTMIGAGLNFTQSNSPVVQVDGSETEAAPSSIDLADAIERSATPLPEHFRRNLLKAGYRVEEKRLFQQVSLPIGGSIEIPTRNVEVTYVGLSAYQ